MPESVQGNHVDNISDCVKPGNFRYFTRSRDELDVIGGMLFRCPCGCNDLCSLNFDPNKPEKLWYWDGNHLNPTLTSSAHNDPTKHPTNCGWHGFLKKGMWISV